MSTKDDVTFNNEMFIYFFFYLPFYLKRGLLENNLSNS